MKLEHRAFLALLVSCGALLGTSAPEPMFVVIPPVETTVPAGQAANFRVVQRPSEERGYIANCEIMARLARPDAQGKDVRLFVSSESAPGQPPVELLLLPHSRVMSSYTGPESARVADVPVGREGARTLEEIRLPACQKASCSTRYRAYTVPPTDFILALRPAARGVPRTGMFPFDSPDVDGARRDAAELLHFYIEPTTPAPATEATIAEPEP